MDIATDSNIDDCVVALIMEAFPDATPEACLQALQDAGNDMNQACAILASSTAIDEPMDSPAEPDLTQASMNMLAEMFPEIPVEEHRRALDDAAGDVSTAASMLASVPDELRTIMEATGRTKRDCQQALRSSGGNVNTAINMLESESRVTDMLQRSGEPAFPPTRKSSRNRAPPVRYTNDQGLGAERSTMGGAGTSPANNGTAATTSASPAAAVMPPPRPTNTTAPTSNNDIERPSERASRKQPMSGPAARRDYHIRKLAAITKLGYDRCAQALSPGSNAKNALYKLLEYMDAISLDMIEEHDTNARRTVEKTNRDQRVSMIQAFNDMYGRRSEETPDGGSEEQQQLKRRRRDNEVRSDRADCASGGAGSSGLSAAEREETAMYSSTTEASTDGYPSQLEHTGNLTSTTSNENEDGAARRLRKRRAATAEQMAPAPGAEDMTGSVANASMATWDNAAPGAAADAPADTTGWRTAEGEESSGEGPGTAPQPQQ